MNTTNTNEKSLEKSGRGGARTGAGRKPKDGFRTSVFLSVEVDALWKGLALKKDKAQITVLEDEIRRAARAAGLTLEEARALIEQDEQRKKSG